MAAAADLTALYRIRKSPGKLKKTRAGTDGPEFILILAVTHPSTDRASRCLIFVIAGATHFFFEFLNFQTLLQH